MEERSLAQTITVVRDAVRSHSTPLVNSRVVVEVRDSLLRRDGTVDRSLLDPTSE